MQFLSFINGEGRAYQPRIISGRRDNSFVLKTDPPVEHHQLNGLPPCLSDAWSQADMCTVQGPWRADERPLYRKQTCTVQLAMST